MKGKVIIEKSFDKSVDRSQAFSKELENGDFKVFFEEEGEYLDRLAEQLKNNGEDGDYFSITYTVKVEI